jgi:hypothetical protein
MCIRHFKPHTHVICYIAFASRRVWHVYGRNPKVRLLLGITWILVYGTGVGLICFGVCVSMRAYRCRLC